jgi:hypothetical protein
MKMENCYVGEAGGARAHSEVGKKHKTGDAIGRPSRGSSFLGNPGAKFFFGKRGNGPNQVNVGQNRTNWFVLFCPSLLEEKTSFSRIQDRSPYGGNHDD